MPSERGLDGSDVVILALLFVAVPPLVLVAIEALAQLVRPALRRGIHLAFVAGLVALIAWQALVDALPALAPVVAYGIAALVGVGVAAAYRRAAVLRTAATVLAPAPLVVLALYLFASPTSALVVGGDPPTAHVGAGSGAPVVFVLFDELPTVSLMDGRHRIDAARYPGFGRLAGASTWYRQAASVGDYTQIAVPALLSGLRVSRGPAPVASKHPHTLFTLLGRSYRIDASEQLTELCPPSACPERVREPFGTRMRAVVQQAVETIPALPPRARRKAADLVAPSPVHRGPVRAFRKGVSRNERAGQGERFERFLATLGRTGPRTLHFVHVELPHRPWKFLPSGRPLPASLQAHGEDVFGVWPRDGALIRRAWRRHLLQTGYADTLLGRTIDRLRREGVWDRALVVVTADHGTSFIGGEQARIATRRNASEVAPVPLFVKAPGQRRGRIDDRAAENLDIVPEIARRLGVRVPWRVDGRPLSGRPPRRPTLTIEREEGGHVTISRVALERERDAALRRKLALFGSGRSLAP